MCASDLAYETGAIILVDVMSLSALANCLLFIEDPSALDLDAEMPRILHQNLDHIWAGDPDKHIVGMLEFMLSMSAWLGQLPGHCSVQ